MRVEIELVSRVPHELRNELRDKTDREFGHVPIVQAHVWAEPTWFFLGYEQDRLVSFLSVVDRHASADDRSIHLFGLNNVVTEPADRHRGHARTLNREAIEFMNNQDGSALGLLFCADALLTFYASLGWQRFGGSVVVAQPAGDRIWSSNCMLHALGQPRQLGFQQIHLCGLPW